MHILGRKKPLHTELTFSEGGQKICEWTIDTQTSHVTGVLGGKENRALWLWPQDSCGFGGPGRLWGGESAPQGSQETIFPTLGRTKAKAWKHEKQQKDRETGPSWHSRGPQDPTLVLSPTDIWLLLLYFNQCTYLNFLKKCSHMWDLSSPTRIELGLPALEVCSPDYWAAREVPTDICSDCLISLPS